MPEKAEARHTLSEQQARQLANVTKTVPMMEQITPRWLVTFLSWVPVEAGTYRVNKVKPTHPDLVPRSTMLSRSELKALPPTSTSCWITEPQPFSRYRVCA